jgi:hypothetical protein
VIDTDFVSFSAIKGKLNWTAPKINLAIYSKKF